VNAKTGDGYFYLYDIVVSESLDCLPDLKVWYEKWKEVRRSQREHTELGKVDLIVALDESEMEQGRLFDV